MDTPKTGIEEKRVKTTIIRRRVKVESPVVPTAESAPQEAGQATEAQTSEKKIETAVSDAAKLEKGEAKSTQEKPEVKKAGAPATSASPGAHPHRPATPAEMAAQAERDRHKKTAKKKTRDELDMEMFERAGGLKKAAELIEVAPERLERVFKPDRNSKKKKVLARKEFRKTEITTPKAIKRVLRVEGSLIVSDLAHRMGVKAGEVLKKLMGLGIVATINHSVDHDTASLIAQEFGYEVENVAFTEESVIEHKETEEDSGQKVSRSPIVTVMGHVDHGKTSLLDAIRKTQVAAGEAGGITQHIGAYKVKVPKGSVTFIDTPGHEAFTSMRARGAQVTDIVIIVVAADDGVMPQTIEAINHAKAAEVPIIVAMNKIDKPGADANRVERGLMEHGLVSEKLGGDTIIVPVSAKTGEGLDTLLEMLLLQSEVLELKANPTRRAVGTIIEARLDKGRGPVATVVIEEGTLHVGDIIVAGICYGKVRALVDDQGQSVKEALPSEPVEILGLSGVPLAGDKVHVTESEEDARTISEHRESKLRLQRHAAQAVPTRLEDLYARASQGEIPDVRVIIKGDMQGSIEALREALIKLSTDKVRVSAIHSGVGAVNESDVMLAVASRAIIVGFNMRPDAKARELAEREKIQIRTYSIIYEVIDDVRKAMEGMLQPTYEEKYLGRAEVRQVFSISKIGTIAGSFVNDGKILRNASVRLVRDGKPLFTGKLSSLKRFKEDAREVLSGLECGIGIENYNDVKVGDTIEAFHIEEIPGKL